MNKSFVSSPNIFFLLAIVLFCIACSNPKSTETKTSDQLAFKVVKVFPHDVTAFTQGLVINNGKLFESTGQANSWIAEVDIVTGKQNKKVVLEEKYFGEGITILNNKIYQLTWQHHIGFVYDLKTFKKISDFQYDYEGWGITHNGSNLIVSDGTDRLHFLDTLSLTQVSTILVTRNGEPVTQLNELEFAEGFVYANQWQTNYILKIDPTNGHVVGRLDFASLTDEILKFNINPDVLNGIAYEQKSKTFLVTGKLWPAVFALRISEPKPLPLAK